MATLEGDKLRLDPAFGITDVNDFKAHLTGFQSGGVDFSVFTFANGLDQITIGGIATTAWTAARARRPSRLISSM